MAITAAAVTGGSMTAPVRASRRWSAVLPLVAALACTGHAAAQADSVARSWNQPVAPFRIIDRIYYVGAHDLASYLIATGAGLILIDGGLVETAPQILRNIRTLGFRPEHVEILLVSHPHYDHVGGIAELKRATGARLFVSAPDAPMLARGGLDDFGFGDRFPFPPVQVDSTFTDGALISLGGVALRANLTAGHTRGCTTWTMAAREAGREYGVLFLCSTSVPGYQLIGNAKYPGIVKDYENSFARLRTLRCDVLLGAHGNFFGLTAKRAALQRGAGPNPFIDPTGCRRDLDDSERAFRRILERQRDTALLLGSQ